MSLLKSNMLAKVTSGALLGLDAVPIIVEVDIASQGLPSFNIVGLPNKAVEESKERVRSAIKNSGASFPAKRITVNLAPADLPKEGSLYDLPIALGILFASGQINNQFEGLILGELGLDGSTRNVSGVLSFAFLAQETGLKNIFLPEGNVKEASIVENIEVFPVKNLASLVNHLNNTEPIVSYIKDKGVFDQKDSIFEIDFADIKGQEQAKRGLEIAAAGGHNLLFSGPPGVGKTMLAKALPSILPPLTPAEAVEVMKIYSIAGYLKNSHSLLLNRPFRNPHHTSSYAGLIGGGMNPKPGEISLAHRGVLFLDEFPEFPRYSLESLRGPLEDGYVTISRALGRVVFPARFTLIASANPCQCGYFGSTVKECICSPSQIQKYKKKISGPILDRIDLYMEVPQVSLEKLTSSSQVESSENVRQRITKARERQLKRYEGLFYKVNGDLGSKDLKNFCKLSTESLAILNQAASQMGLSARGYNKVLKVARTIADLQECENIEVIHLAEALQYRAKPS